MKNSIGQEHNEYNEKLYSQLIKDYNEALERFSAQSVSLYPEQIKKEGLLMQEWAKEVKVSFWTHLRKVARAQEYTKIKEVLVKS